MLLISKCEVEKAIDIITKLTKKEQKTVLTFMSVQGLEL